MKLKKAYIDAGVLLAVALFVHQAHADQAVHMSCMSRDTKTQFVANFVVMGDGIARGSIQRLDGGQAMSVNQQTASISYSLKGRHTQMRFRPLSGLSGVRKAILTLPGNLESGTVTTGAARLVVRGTANKSSVSTVNCQLAQM